MKTMAIRLGLVLIFLVVILQTSLSKEVKPGVKSRITQNGLNYARDLALDILMKEFENIQVSWLTRPEAVLETIPGLGLHLSATGLRPYIKSEFSLLVNLGFFGFMDTSNVTINGENMSFDLQFSIGRSTSTGQPDISNLSCDREGDVTIGSEGSNDYIKLVPDLYEDKICYLILSQICYQAEQLVQEQASLLLSTFPVQKNMFDNLELDYSLTNAPNFTQEYFDVFFKGAVYVSTNVEEPPFDPPIIPRYPDHVDKMMYVYITNYLFNSGFYAAFKSGLLFLEIRPDSNLIRFPSALEQYLLTSCSIFDLCLGNAFPSISEEYPDSTIEVEVRPTKAPLVNIHDAVIKIKANLDLILCAVQSEGCHPFFTINANVTSEWTAHVQGAKVTFHFENVTTSIDKESDVFNASFANYLIEKVANIVVNGILLRKLQGFGREGFELPVIDGVHFVNPEIITSASTGDVLVIATDINYARPG